MGASDSKLVFKKGIFRLSEERHIPADDPYWTSFWELPESSEDIFSLFSPADIRRTRDRALENIETLILAATSRLFVLRHHPSFPDPELAPERDALNCIRILTRVLPYLYEVENLAEWEEKFFWGARRKRSRNSSIANEVLFDEAAAAGHEGAGDGNDTPGSPPPRPAEFEDAKPLAEELIDTLIDLLFFSDLTLPKQPHGTSKVTYAIWQSGVGCNTAVATTREYESNRCEILRLLLAMAGQSMYKSPSLLPQKGVRALTYMCTCADKQIVLSVLCSLLNTTLKYNPATWRVPYNALVFKDPKQILVTYALQLMLVLILYPIPEHAAGPANAKNFYRHFLGRLHRPQDFQFIFDGMRRILNQPLQEKASYLPGTQSPTKFAPEMIMLFWEITQCNKRFRSFIVDTERAHDFVVLTLFYALEYKNDASKQGVVRMCAFLLQTLSVETNFGVGLNKTFEGQESLPPSIKITGFRGTYADFLIQSIYNLITTSQGKLSAIYPALLAVINNIAAYLEGISLTSGSRLMQLFASMSSPSFLLANDSNHDLLRSLLESVNAIVEHQFKKNPELIYAILRQRKKIEALRTFTLESGQQEIEQRNRRRKEAAANGEVPPDTHSLRSSVESLRSPTSPVPLSMTTPTRETHAAEEIVGGGGGAFAIGDDDDESSDEDDHRHTPSQSEVPSQASSTTGGHLEDRDALDAVPTQVRGMSEKARGKMPAGGGGAGGGGFAFSRQNSMSSVDGGGGGGGGSPRSGGAGAAGTAFEPSAEWIESWLPELPLHTLLAVVQQVGALLPRQALAGATSGGAAGTGPGTVSSPAPGAETLARIQEVRLVGVEPSPPRVHSFEWSGPALGWYESLIWGLVFSSELAVARGSVGIWNATAIRLFRVQETAAAGPTLMAPRGAVDAVGSNIVSRIGAINLRGGQPGAGTGNLQGHGQ